MSAQAIRSINLTIHDLTVALLFKVYMFTYVNILHPQN